MKRVLIILAMVASTLSVRAQLAEAWINMPDSLCPYLNSTQRLQLYQYASAGSFDTITNSFDGKTVVDSINSQVGYLSLQVTPTLHWRLFIVYDLDKQTGESRKYIGLVSECCAPRCSTFRTIYDLDWNLIERRHEPFILEENDDERKQYF